MPSEHCRAVVDTCDLSDKDKDKDNGIESDLVIYIYIQLTVPDILRNLNPDIEGL